MGCRSCHSCQEQVINGIKEKGNERETQTTVADRNPPRGAIGRVGTLGGRSTYAPWRCGSETRELKVKLRVTQVQRRSAEDKNSLSGVSRSDGNERKIPHSGAEPRNFDLKVKLGDEQVTAARGSKARVQHRSIRWPPRWIVIVFLFSFAACAVWCVALAFGGRCLHLDTRSSTKRREGKLRMTIAVTLIMEARAGADNSWACVYGQEIGDTYGNVWGAGGR